MSDPGGGLLDTDAPSAAEQSLPQSRFVQAVRVKDEWFVQFEIAMTSGVTTIGYVRTGNGSLRRWPPHYFGGPPCASIAAALAGVTTPGGFNF